MAKTYGYDSNGRPLRTQKEVVRNYFLNNTGKANAMSHEDCKTRFGFTRLSAIVFDIQNQDGIAVSRERRTVPTRYEGITAEPTYYWVEQVVADAYKSLAR